MAALSSALASFSWAGTAVNGLGTVSIQYDQTMIDTTDIATGPRTYIVGNRGCTATIDMFYDQSSTAMAAIETAINTGSGSASAIVTLASGMTYTGQAFVQSFSATASTNEVVRANFTIQYTGTITIA
jgi:hypothetical protein